MAHPHDESPACAAGRGHSSARDIGALFRHHQDAFRRSHSLGAMQRRALRDISACRTGALGGHRDVCGQCGCERMVFNSCRNRHCPKCQALRQARWVSERMQRALPTYHFHVVFTLPAELRELVHLHEELLLDLLFASASETLLELAADPKRLDGLLGISAVVHTWGRNLIFHPHLHCIVTGGALRPDQSWTESSEKFLLPVKVLGKLFRGKFIGGLAQLFQQGKLPVTLSTPDRVASLLPPASHGSRTSSTTKNGSSTPRLPSRSQTHSFATSKTCQLPPLEFIRRFLQHVLPRCFVKVRHFGLYAAGNVKSKLAAARATIEKQATTVQAPSPSPSPSPPPPPDWRDFFRQLTGIDLGECPHCGGRLSSEPLANAAHASRAPPAQTS